jgi:hypothetical protein
MSVDLRGEHAARTLLESVPLDVEHRLDALKRLRRRRAMQRAGVGLVLVLICAGWAASALRQPQAALEPVTPTPAPAFPSLDATYEVLDRAVSPSGTQEAFAAFRRGQSAGVFLRDRGEREPRALWVPPQPNGQLRERTSWPVSLAWAPDGEHIAFLVLTHKGDLKQVRRAEVALWSVPLGGATPQEFQDDLGACYCLQFTPALEWASDAATITVTVPNGTKGTQFTVQAAP